MKYFLYIDIVSLFTSSKGCRIIFFYFFVCLEIVIHYSIYLAKCFLLLVDNFSADLSHPAPKYRHTALSRHSSHPLGWGGAGRGDGGGAGGESLKMLLRGHVTSAPAPSHLASSAANMLQSTHASVQPRHSHCDIIRIVNIIVTICKF